MEVGHADDGADWVINCSPCVSLVLKTETSLGFYHNSGGLGGAFGQSFRGWTSVRRLANTKALVPDCVCWLGMLLASPCGASSGSHLLLYS